MLDSGKTGLVVVDIQGRLARIVHDSDAFIATTVKLIRGFRTLDLPIVWLEQNPEKLGATAPEVGDALAGITPLPKFTFNGCRDQGISSHIDAPGVTTWVVCGIEAHICVYQTSRGLLAAGFGVEVATDCVSSRSAHNISVALSRLASAGAGLTTMEMCLYELVADCRAPAFRSILEIVR